ncbi:MAG TPA: alanine--tRNA ligase [Dehalococcoidia bacterium]|nr:alanine--tRNA ligase [Dehalococcoidia bacterium]
MNTREIRELFTRFFEERGHQRVPSSSLIPPPEERTILFTTAGMAQMKPYFMGLARPPATRMTSIQKCFRASDIEEVGDQSHCTFFEMLGNFSVGDYFKAEVIPWAWELLTSKEHGLGLSKDRIWPTVFLDDQEAFEIWQGLGVPPERIRRYGEDKNYWFMGRVGPCGPNTEIFYDFGSKFGCMRAECHPNCDKPMKNGQPCNRFIELWNLVFMTLYQSEDGSRRPLPQRNVDTGGGIERWPMAWMFENGVDWQGKSKTWEQPPTIYDADGFQAILEKIEELSGFAYESPTTSGAQRRGMRVLAEHTRAAAFLISDGVFPSNEDRGYVLRRLIRRAIYYTSRYGIPPELSTISKTVIEKFSDIYPQLKEQESLITRLLYEEETRFLETMGRGSTELNARLSALSGQGKVQLPGEAAFFLHDTWGFPIELTREIAQDWGFAVDEEAFETLMEEQRTRSRAGGHFEGDAERIQTYAELGLAPTEFVGYEDTRANSIVSAILLDGTTVVRALTPALAAAHRVEVVLDHTPFYSEGGGQVGDRGEIVWPGGQFIVDDTQAVGDGGVVAHVGHLEAGELSVNDFVEARVNEDVRADVMRNHTATHILHAALRNVLGPHARQAGSLVTPDRLRFDFTHLEAMTPDQIRQVELLANKAVRENLPVSVDYLSYEDALEGGALAFFGDKYANTVRVVGICDEEADRCFSKELCGGTHVHASGDVGSIIITAETSIGAGLRRIEAVTGRAAAERARQQEETLARLGASLNAPPAEIESRLATMREENDRLRRQIQTMERRMASLAAGAAASPAGPAAGIADKDNVVVERVADAPSIDFLRTMGDAYKQRYKSAAILLGALIDGKPAFLAMSTPDVAPRVAAGDVVRTAAREAGGSGGGSPALAQGGGTDASKLDAALAAGRKLIEEKLASS